jgi:hypothetical protein
VAVVVAAAVLTEKRVEIEKAGAEVSKGPCGVRRRDVDEEAGCPDPCAAAAAGEGQWTPSHLLAA